MARINEIVARLAAGSVGRTEADVQADVRGFLLEAPLELAVGQIIDVALEAQAGGGRRIDVEAGCAAIEVKKSLASSSTLNAAVKQLAGYVQQRTDERAERYVGVLTDGRTWILFHLRPDRTLAEVNRIVLRGAEDAERLAAWFEPVLATTSSRKPTPREIVRTLGSGSTAAALDLADLRALYAVCRSDPEVQLKRQLWARLLLSALGTNFEDSDELFITHTYLVLTAGLVAHEVMGIPIATATDDVRALLEGRQFADGGLHGVVEADFFDWPAITDQGFPVIAGIARRLGMFDWTSVDRDVLKSLYESVIDVDTRKQLGEYYTPDWLAQKLIDERFTDPLEQSLLDPACGSGTFMFWAIRRFLEACDAADVPNREALDRVVRQVQGMDLHPVAVTLARVTYLLALTPERLADRGDLTVPVFLGDSVRWDTDDVSLSTGGITVRTSDELELLQDELHFPEGVIEEPARFDRLVADLATKASKRKRGSKAPSIAGLLNFHNVSGPDDRMALETVFKKLCRLHDNGRDHVWSYYIRNRARPLSFTKADGRADILVGNPPWLAYRHMPKSLQVAYRALAEARGLWAGGKVATHQDLSDLFVVRAAELYLKPGGEFAFVMPHSVLSRRQFAGFRTGEWSIADGATLHAQFDQPEDFSRVKPALFNAAACVVYGQTADSPSALPAETVRWIGQVPGRHLDWPNAASHLKAGSETTATAVDSAESPYRAQFAQGATLVPRMLVTVHRSQTAGRIGVSAGRVAVESARSPLEKLPWRDLRSLKHAVEERFVRPTHLGATIVAYRARTPELSIVPWVDGHLLHAEHERLDEFPGLAAWWRDADDVWETNKSRASTLSLRDQVDFQGKLKRQLPGGSNRVVYTKSGQHIAACRIDEATAVIDHTLYWSSVDSLAEARYLTAILNSRALIDAVAPLQARGQHNPRHFDMHVFALPFPKFDPSAGAHAALAQLAARAEAVAEEVELDGVRQFQRARRAVREALQEEGVADSIDEAVRELLMEAVAAHPAAPDLMAALSAASRGSRAKRSTKVAQPQRARGRKA